MAQPPWVNPLLGSSSGPPGACMTPSRVTCVIAMTFLIVCSPVFLIPHVGRITGAPFGLALAVFVGAPPPLVGLVASERGAVEPLVHAPQNIHTTFVG